MGQELHTRTTLLYVMKDRLWVSAWHPHIQERNSIYWEAGVEGSLEYCLSSVWRFYKARNGQDPFKEADNAVDHHQEDPDHSAFQGRQLLQNHDGVQVVGVVLVGGVVILSLHSLPGETGGVRGTWIRTGFKGLPWWPSGHEPACRCPRRGLDP